MRYKYLVLAVALISSCVYSAEAQKFAEFRRSIFNRLTVGMQISMNSYSNAKSTTNSGKYEDCDLWLINAPYATNDAGVNLFQEALEECLKKHTLKD